MVRGGFRSIDLANAVILVFALFLETSIRFLKSCWDVGFWDCSMISCQNGCKELSIRRITGEAGMLDPIKLTLVGTLSVRNDRPRIVP